MAICSLGHEHPDESPAEVVPVPVDSGPNENDVRIAEIEAAASIEREKIWTEQQALALEANNEELRGEIRGMREILDRLAPPEPDPSDAPPVVVPAPVPMPETESESTPAPPEVETKSKTNSKSGYWDSYR